MLKGEFIGGARGRLFCVIRFPIGRPRYAVMIVPAFGDEMNKTRRMITELARRLNELGIAVLIPDVYGTGDSDGSFSDASWDGWLEDLATIRDWGEDEGLAVRGVVAVRTGALLAAQLFQSASGAALDTTVFWQPVRSGKAFVRQLLRVRTVANAVNAGARETVDELTSRLSNGETILVGGYPLAAPVVSPLAALELDQLDCTSLGSLHVVEITRVAENCGRFAEKIGRLSAKVFRYSGEPYWNSTETLCDLNVVARTVASLQDGQAV